jgi:hypothetical protein
LHLSYEIVPQEGSYIDIYLVKRGIVFVKSNYLLKIPSCYSSRRQRKDEPEARPKSLVIEKDGAVHMIPEKPLKEMRD